MEKQLLYKNLAKYYDLIYSFKDYKKEAEVVRQLIKKYKKSKGKNLLEVACGTGKHIQYLKSDFSCTATDINEGMLKVARKNVKGVVFKKADMTKLNLGKEFDVIICLFSSIGYVRTYANLKKTIDNFAKHLKPGGVVIIEPWLPRSVYKVGLPHMDTYDGEDIKIARSNVSDARGNISILDMHYQIAEKNKEVEHFVDRHELGMFDEKKFIEFMRKGGFDAKYLKGGLLKDRGLYVGVKK